MTPEEAAEYSEKLGLGKGTDEEDAEDEDLTAEAAVQVDTKVKTKPSPAEFEWEVVDVSDTKIDDKDFETGLDIEGHEEKCENVTIPKKN